MNGNEMKCLIYVPWDIDDNKYRWDMLTTCFGHTGGNIPSNLIWRVLLLDGDKHEALPQ